MATRSRLSNNSSKRAVSKPRMTCSFEAWPSVKVSPASLSRSRAKSTQAAVRSKVRTALRISSFLRFSSDGSRHAACDRARRIAETSIIGVSGPLGTAPKLPAADDEVTTMRATGAGLRLVLRPNNMSAVPCRYDDQLKGRESKPS